MNIGAQTRPWGPERNRRDLPGVLGEVREAGYDGIEIGAQHLDIDKPREFSELLSSFGLKVAGIHVGGEIYNLAAVQAALDNLERTIAFAAAAGASYLPFSGKAKEGKTQDELNVQAESLNRVGQLCQQNGIRLAYHNHNWEIHNGCAELEHLCANTDPALVSLCLDVAWVHRGGAELGEVLRRRLDRVAYFHLKDSTATEWRELGRGDVDLQAPLRALQEREFGWAVWEQDETAVGAFESARISREYLRSRLV
jgi:sugar phosphate isomerase/epimerase